VFSEIAFFTFRHYVPFGVYYIQHYLQSTFFLLSTFCPILRFLPSFLCPFIIIYHSTFFLLFNVFPSTFFPIRRVVRRRFFTVGVFYFDVLSDVLWYVLHYVPLPFPATKVGVAGGYICQSLCVWALLQVNFISIFSSVAQTLKKTCTVATEA
jgi:hypothetical protein